MNAADDGRAEVLRSHLWGPSAACSPPCPIRGPESGFTAFSYCFLSPVPLLGQTFEEFSGRASAAREAGKPAEAVRNYQAALKLKPDWEEGWFYLGTLFYDGDRYADAIGPFEHVVNLDPKLGLAWNLLGLSEFETRNYKASLQHLQRAQEVGLGDNPDADKVGKYHIALLLNLNGEFEKATDLLVSEFGKDRPPEQIKTALGIALLRVPLLPQQIDPSKDALVRAAGEAASLLAARRIEEALPLFEQMLKDYPGTRYLHYAYGSALASLGRKEQAEAQFREEARVSPKSALPHMRLAALAIEAHRMKDAQVSAENAVKLAPQWAPAHEMLAKVLQASGSAAQATTELATAKRLSYVPAVDEELASAYARGGPDQAETHTEASLPPAGEDLAARAAAERDAGDLTAAIRDYQAEVKRRPDWEEGWQQLGTLLYATGRHPEAVAAFKKLVQLNPRLGSAWALLGLSEFETKDYKNALIHLQHGQELGLTGNAAAMQTARYHLAALLNLNGEFDRAMELLVPEIGPGPFQEQVRQAMGIALLRMPVLPDQVPTADRALVRSAGETAALLAQSRYDEAFPLLKQMLKDHPGTPFLHFANGSALASLSQYEEAEMEFREEAKISPQSALPYIRMASIALRLHHGEDAAAAAQRAVELTPQSFTAHYMLGRALLETGKPEQAVKEFETANRLEPSSPEVHFNLARAYAKAKMPEQAEQERAIFARLNAASERQKNMHGPQSYADSHDRGDLTPGETASAPGATPE